MHGDFLKAFEKTAFSFSKAFTKANIIHHGALPAVAGTLGAVGSYASSKSQESKYRVENHYRDAFKAEHEEAGLKGDALKQKVDQDTAGAMKHHSRNAAIAGGLAGGLSAAILFGGGKPHAQSGYHSGRGYGGGGGGSGSGARGFAGRSGIADPHKVMAWDKAAIKTKAQAKQHWKSQAMKHHPDRGGDPAKMKDLNGAFEDIERSDWFKKLAFLQGFEKKADFAGMSARDMTHLGGTVLGLNALHGAAIGAMNGGEYDSKGNVHHRGIGAIRGGASAAGGTAGAALGGFAGAVGLGRLALKGKLDRMSPHAQGALAKTLLIGGGLAGAMIGAGLGGGTAKALGAKYDFEKDN